MNWKIWSLAGLLAAAFAVQALTGNNGRTKAQAADTSVPPPVTPAPAPAAAPASTPSGTGGVSSLELRGNTMFNNGQYALALPILQRVAESLKDQPDRLGQVQEQIRVCQHNLNAAKPAANPMDPNAQNGPPSAEARKAHPAVKDGEVYEVPIKDLGNFQYDADKGGNIPDDVKALDGKTVRTHGFMIALDQAKDVTHFALVPSLFSCCFGQPPQVQHTIYVNTPAGKAIEYCPDELVIEGKLHVRETKDEDFIVSIFDMEATSVRPMGR